MLFRLAPRAPRRKALKRLVPLAARLTGASSVAHLSEATHPGPVALPLENDDASSLDRRRRRRMVIAIASALGGAAAVLGAYLAAGPLVRSLVLEEATALGVTLDPGTLSFGWGWVRLDRARFTLEGTGVLTGEAERVTITLDRLTPLDIKATGVTLGLVGPPGEVIGALAAWEKRSEQRRLAPPGGAAPGAPAPPVSATDLSFSWREARGGAATLEARGDVTPTPTGGALKASSASAAGHALGAATISWARTAQALVIAPVEGNPSSASIRAEFPRGTTPPAARLIVHDTAVSSLGGLGTLPAQARNARVDGALELRFPTAGGVEGSLKGSLKGVVLPVPREVAGLVSSTETTMTASIHGAPGSQVVDLSPLAVTSGTVHLKGPAQVERKGDRGVFHAQLSGAVPCAAVARSAAVTDLGNLVGGLLGEVAGVALEGSVKLGLTVDADTTNPGAASFKPSVGVGCGLRLPGGF
jgi:hypothetical protein